MMNCINSYFLCPINVTFSDILKLKMMFYCFYMFLNLVCQCFVYIFFVDADEQLAWYTVSALFGIKVRLV